MFKAIGKIKERSPKSISATDNDSDSEWESLYDTDRLIDSFGNLKEAYD